MAKFQCECEFYGEFENVLRIRCNIIVIICIFSNYPKHLRFESLKIVQERKLFSRFTSFKLDIIMIKIIFEQKSSFRY